MPLNCVLRLAVSSVLIPGPAAGTKADGDGVDLVGKLAEMTVDSKEGKSKKKKKNKKK